MLSSTPLIGRKRHNTLDLLFFALCPWLMTKVSAAQETVSPVGRFPAEKAHFSVRRL